MKRHWLAVFGLGVCLALVCCDDSASTAPRYCEQTTDCVLSLCSCSCYAKGERPEDKNGKVCGINCEEHGGVSGCECEGNTCMETHVSLPDALSATDMDR
jgi:hypothetical protein